jgi:hypothetical protein
MSDQLDPQRDVGPPGAPPPPEAPTSPDAPPPEMTVDDADDLRSFHFKRLLAKTGTKIWIGIVVAAAGIGAAVAVGPLIGLIAAVAVLLVALLIVFGIADSASEQDFFDIYARQRGLTRSGDASIGPMTPLLRKGDERKVADVLRGPLAEGIDGGLAQYTYTDVYHDKDGRHETDYPFTIAWSELPDSVPLCPALYCNRQSGFRFMEGVEDTFRHNVRVNLESEKLGNEYEIFVGPDQDQNWIRQLFSPTFIVWLADSAPEKFAFELESGVLCCNIKGHHKDAAHLDELRESLGAIAARIREEVAESVPST